MVGSWVVIGWGGKWQGVVNGWGGKWLECLVARVVSGWGG